MQDLELLVNEFNSKYTRVLGNHKILIKWSIDLSYKRKDTVVKFGSYTINSIDELNHKSGNNIFCVESLTPQLYIEQSGDKICHLLMYFQDYNAKSVNCRIYRRNNFKKIRSSFYRFFKSRIFNKNMFVFGYEQMKVSHTKMFNIETDGKMHVSSDLNDFAKTHESFTVVSSYLKSYFQHSDPVKYVKIDEMSLRY
jgi:hypothetical protein